MTDVLEFKCTFCGRDADDCESGLLTSATGAMICQTCANTSAVIFMRREEIHEQALKLSIESRERGETTNNEGQCMCPACVAGRLMRSDRVIKEVAEIFDAMADKAITRH